MYEEGLKTLLEVKLQMFFSMEILIFRIHKHMQPDRRQVKKELQKIKNKYIFQLEKDNEISINLERDDIAYLL